MNMFDKKKIFTNTEEYFGEIPNIFYLFILIIKMSINLLHEFQKRNNNN